MNKRLTYHEEDGFKSDFKKLLKKYRTLESDFDHVKSFVIENLHIKKIEFNDATPKVESFCSDKYVTIKVKKFPCKAMKGKGARTGIRVIYVHELGALNIYFIEIYTHSEGVDNLNKKRLDSFLRRFNEK